MYFNQFRLIVRIVIREKFSISTDFDKCLSLIFELVKVFCETSKNTVFNAQCISAQSGNYSQGKLMVIFKFENDKKIPPIPHYMPEISRYVYNIIYYTYLIGFNELFLF